MKQEHPGREAQEFPGFKSWGGSHRQMDEQLSRGLGGTTWGGVGYYDLDPDERVRVDSFIESTAQARSLYGRVLVAYAVAQFISLVILVAVFSQGFDLIVAGERLGAENYADLMGASAVVAVVRVFFARFTRRFGSDLMEYAYDIHSDIVQRHCVGS